MDKKFLPLGLAVFAPPPPPPHSCLWSSDYRGESSIGTLLVCTVAKIHIEAACFETSETYQHRHLMPYCTSILTRASTTTREDSFYLCCPSTWQNKLLYQYLFLLLNSGYSPPPQHSLSPNACPWLPLQTCVQSFCLHCEGLSPRIVPRWQSRHFMSGNVSIPLYDLPPESQAHTLKRCPRITTVSSIRKHGFLPLDRHRN